MMIQRRGRGLFVAATIAILTASAQAQQAPHRSARATEVLGLLDAELVHVELPAPVGGQQMVALEARGLRDVLVLRPQNVRSPGYQLLAQRADGTFAVSRSRRPQAFRGFLAGQPGSVVSGSLSDEGLFARIVLPDGRSLWLEPLSARLPDASAVEYVLYEDDDVIESGLPCAVPLMADNATDIGGGETDGTQSAPTTSSATTLKVAEIACDADYEYFASYGSITAVEARIHSVIDAINLQYESEVGITHRITTIIVRTSATQPYTATDSGDLLVQLRNEWNANHGSIARDITHLFTGKELAGSVIGIAYLGVICNQSYGYGLSQSDFSSSFASATDLTAHELGHNWNAGHCSCTSFTMNPYITAANAFSPLETIPAIEAFRDSRTCLDDESTEPPPPADPEVNLSLAESITSGTLTAADHRATHVQDGVSEVITEASSGGKPAKRRTMMSHTWTFDVQPGAGYTFHLDAHHSNNLEGDDFQFSFSRDGSVFSPMLTVTKTAGDNTLQSFAFAQDVAGTLFIRVEDTDRSAGNTSKDSLSIDYMFVQTELDGVDTTPPSAPTGLAAVAGDGIVSLDWGDNNESDLDGYNVYRSESEAGPFSLINLALLAASAANDDSVVNGTSYHFRVSAVDLDGNESSPSASLRVIPNAGGGVALSSLVSSILVTGVNIGGGQKQGRADVWIIDDRGAPVVGALVTGSFSGALTETLVTVTDAQGLAIFVTSQSKKGSLALTFCADDVSHASLNYTPSLNVETCDVR